MATRKGVLYQITGGKHSVVFVVSVYSLRQYYTGPITILAGDDAAFEIACRCANDQRLGDISIKRFDAFAGRTAKGSGWHYCNKTLIHEQTPYEKTLFLDADTIIAKDISRLWPGPGEIILTQFADWWSTGRKIRGRIESWMHIAPELVKPQLELDYPAINTGVFAFDGNEEARNWMREWRALNLRNIVFIGDEIANQLMLSRTDLPKPTILTDHYNCSPIYSSEESKKNAVIYHCHGKKHVRKEAGRAVWLPWYDRCIQENIAGLREWTPGADRHLKKWLESTDSQYEFMCGCGNSWSSSDVNETHCDECGAEAMLT